MVLARASSTSGCPFRCRLGGCHRSKAEPRMKGDALRPYLQLTLRQDEAPLAVMTLNGTRPSRKERISQQSHRRHGTPGESDSSTQELATLVEHAIRSRGPPAAEYVIPMHA
jgi:hypothetical protein